MIIYSWLLNSPASQKLSLFKYAPQFPWKKHIFKFPILMMPLTFLKICVYFYQHRSIVYFSDERLIIVHRQKRRSQKRPKAKRLANVRIKLESLSTHNCWALNQSFIPSLVVWSVTKNNVFCGEQQK